MVAAVVIISFIIALLVFVMNVSLKQQTVLLEEMGRVNKELTVSSGRIALAGLCWGLEMVLRCMHLSSFCPRHAIVPNRRPPRNYTLRRR